MTSEILKQLKNFTGSSHTAGNGCGYAGTHLPIPASNSHYSEQEMIDAFLTGYQAFNLMEECPNQDVINLAKDYLRKLKC